MNDYKTRVVSVRLDASLVEAIRARAEAGGRSLSGQIVHLVREQVVAWPQGSGKRQPITGWLARRPSPETLAEFAAARKVASTRLKRAIREKAKRR